MLLQCFATVLGIGLVVYLFVSRFVYHDPNMQDPCQFLVLVALALIVIGIGYFPGLVMYCEEMETRTHQ